MNNGFSFSYNFTCIRCGKCDYSTPEESELLYCKHCGREYPEGHEELMKYHEPKIRELMGNMSENVKNKIIRGMYAKFRAQIGKN